MEIYIWLKDLFGVVNKFLFYDVDDGGDNVFFEKVKVRKIVKV